MTPGAPTRREFLARTTLAAALAPARLAARPNIILLLADDLGWSDLGCYGNKLHETPSLDLLAQQGVRFTDAYAACPVCSPTRASILTGKYPARLHLTDWIPGRPQWPSARLLTPQFEQHLPLAETTVAEALKPLGYRTASIGKWHLGGDGFHPENQGFDVNVGGNERGSPKSYFGPFDLPNLTGGTKDDYLTEKLTEAAQNFILENASSGPFFLYLPQYTVHLPLQARQQAIEEYRRKIGDKPFPNAVYAAMVESFDRPVGLIRALLEQLEIAGQTILIVTSDNGGLRYEGKSQSPVTDNSPLRAGKGHLYEGGIREPLIVYWPGVTKVGHVIRRPVSSVDLMPTIVEMAGGKAPGTDVIDGQSLTELLRKDREPKRDALYWHYPHYSNQGGVPAGAVRQGDWKLIEFYEDGRLELFRLRDDIGERVNLVEKEYGRAKKMRELLAKWRQSAGAVMPQPNPNYDPATANQGLTGAEPPTLPL
jgi:arylsulfatase A